MIMQLVSCCRPQARIILLIIASMIAWIVHIGTGIGNTKSDSSVEGLDGATRVTGTVIHASDVASIPDTPYGSGAVVAVPATRWHDLSARIGLNEPPLRHAQFTLPRAAFDELVADSAGIRDDGTYELDLIPGRYIICVGNLGAPPPAPEVYPVVVGGCLEVRVPEGPRHRLDILFGEGGATGG